MDIPASDIHGNFVPLSHRTVNSKWRRSELSSKAYPMGFMFTELSKRQTQKDGQITLKNNIKFTQFKDNDSRTPLIKYYLLRSCSFWEISKTMLQQICLSPLFYLKILFCDFHFFFFLKNLTTNEAETSTGKLHLHSQGVGIPFHGPKPLKPLNTNS